MPPGVLTKDAARISSARQSSEKEAKALSHELNDLLKHKDPWQQDVAFARENLRRHCLALIFQRASGKETAGGTAHAQTQARERLQGLNVLFLSTSHNVIQHFRQRLNAMDKSIANKSAHGQAPSRRDERGGGHASASPAQRKKLLHIFREFLAREEAVWRELLIRIVGVFDVEEARAALRILQLGIGDWEPDQAFKQNREIHDQAVLLCHRTLVCYGDLTRYKELYAENKQDVIPKARGGKLAPANAEREKGKDYSTAFEAYHQARLLVPDDGNPSNQLAVLAGYQQDTFGSIYHYYRALCVQKSFTTARQNLGTTFKKALAAYQSEEQKKVDKLKAKTGSYTDVDDQLAALQAKFSPEQLLDGFKREFVALHAMLFEDANMEPIPKQFTKVTKLFGIGASKRALPSDVIVKTFVLSISAWWHARMHRKTAAREDIVQITDDSSLESSVLMLLLAVVAELLSLATGEIRLVQLPSSLRRPSPISTSEKSMLLGQAISAIFRRSLPALRIASMWLLSSIDYLSKYDATAALFKVDDPSVAPEVCSAIRGFWNSYANFANAMSKAFPLELLPVSAGDLMLEEDIDMMGFAPLRRRIRDVSGGKPASATSGAVTAPASLTSENLHPNEEQVLRLGDLLSDANLLAQAQACPLIVERGFFQIRTKRLNPTSQPWSPIKTFTQLPQETIASPDPEPELSDGEAETTSDVGSESYEATEEDVLDLAMRVATSSAHANLSDEDDEDEDVILYPLRNQVPSSRPASNTPSPPVRQALIPGGTLPAGSNAGISTRTASDLLLQVLQGKPLDTSPTMGAALPPGLQSIPTNPSPFSTSLASMGGQSIWSSPSVPALQYSSPHRAPNPPSRFGAMGSESVAAASAEALFNSMPNQSQPQGARHSPSSSQNLFDPPRASPHMRPVDVHSHAARGRNGPT